MVDNKENYILDLGVKGLNKEIYDTIFTFSQKVSLTKKNNQPWPGWWNRHNFLPIFLFGFFAHLLQTKVKWHKKVILVHRVHKVHKESYIHNYITCLKIPHKWIVHFMCADSFVEKQSASTIHCQAGKETKSTFNPFSL